LRIGIGICTFKSLLYLRLLYSTQFDQWLWLNVRARDQEHVGSGAFFFLFLLLSDIRFIIRWTKAKQKFSEHSTVMFTTEIYLSSSIYKTTISVALCLVPHNMLGQRPLDLAFSQTPETEIGQPGLRWPWFFFTANINKTVVL
jgi:hypothetical protein